MKNVNVYLDSFIIIILDKSISINHYFVRKYSQTNQILNGFSFVFNNKYISYSTGVCWIPHKYRFVQNLNLKWLHYSVSACMLNHTQIQNI